MMKHQEYVDGKVTILSLEESIEINDRINEEMEKFNREFKTRNARAYKHCFEML